MLNSDVQEFLKRNEINLNEINANVDCHIYSEYEVNEISYNYGFRKKSEMANISIADIVGYNTDDKMANVFLSMGEYFDSQSSGYRSRSIGMLQYSSDEIIERLNNSFQAEPIQVEGTGEGKYLISVNGLHRYTVLRAHYLNEIEKCKGDKTKEENIKQKYTIPVKVRELDSVKTYSKFLLEKYVSDIRSCRAEYNGNFDLTGNVIIIKDNGESMVLNDDELVEFLRKKLIEVSQQEDIKSWKRLFKRKNVVDFRELKKYFKYESFRNFVGENLKDIIRIEILKEKEEGR